MIIACAPRLRSCSLYLADRGIQDDSFSFALARSNDSPSVVGDRIVAIIFTLPLYTRPDDADGYNDGLTTNT